MTRSFTFSALILTSLIFPSCFLFSKKTTSDDPGPQGNWIHRAEFNGVARSEAVSFVIGDTAYMGTGYDGTNRLSDIWKYDPDKDYWLQRASLPSDANPRSSATAFATSTKGYITAGYNGAVRLKDTWEYDPVKNGWTKKADFGGSARYDAVGFGINNKGYVTTGNDGNDLKDIWMYDPVTDTWAQKANPDGLPRSGAVVFVYKNQAYIVTGSNNGAPVNDLWVYDPAADKWAVKRPVSNVSTDTYDDNYNIVRNNATAFVMGDYAYLCTGENGAIQKTVWEYKFADDTWIQKTSWEGLERTGAVSFTVKTRGFLVTGRNSTYRFDDMREFKPFDVYYPND